MIKLTRTLVAGLAVSATFLIGLAVKEGYVDTAMVPMQNDRPTVGFGSTFNEDGTPVKLGDRTDPVRALIKAHAHITKEEARFRASLPGVSMYQGEYDLYMDWVYQYGTGRWEKSSMRRHLMARNYQAACDALLLYKYAGGFDCSDPKNWYGKGGDCRGVWDRQVERHRLCTSLQGG